MLRVDGFRVKGFRGFQGLWGSSFGVKVFRVWGLKRS